MLRQIGSGFRQRFGDKFEVGFFLLAAVVVTCGYAWMAATSLEPKSQVPTGVISRIVRIDGTRVIHYEEGRSLYFIESSRIEREMTTINRAQPYLGSFPQRIQIIINGNDPLHYVVTDNTIEIGTDVVRAKGQLSKAILKSWVLQKASPEFRDSLLRREVITDFLLAVFNGDFRLELPASNGIDLTFSPVSNWITSASSFEATCASPWMSLELRGLCGGSDQINPIAFRALISGMLWRIYDSTPNLSKAQFIRAFLAHVQSGAKDKPVVGYTPSDTSLEAWQAWVRSQFELLVPSLAELNSAGMSDRAREVVNRTIQSVEKDARLSPGSKPSLDFIFQVPQSEDPAPSLLKGLGTEGSPSAALGVQIGDQLVLWPGRGKMSIKAGAEWDVKHLVIESCKVPRLGDLLENPIRSERVLFIRHCPEVASPELVNYEPLVSLGVEAFAARFPTLSFLQLRLSAVELALKRKALSPEIRLTHLMKPNADVSSLLGLSEAKWQDSPSAYRVVGAIEAVEWFRSDN